MASKPKKPVEQPKPLETYGCRMLGFDQTWYNQRAFAAKTPIDKGAPTRDVLFWKLADEFVPNYFEKHDWTLKVVNTLLEYKWIGVAGCSGSAKTRNIVGAACVWWMSAPLDSSVLLCSTTAKALRKRGWAEVQRYFSSIPSRPGNFVDSRMLWQSKKGDDKHAISGIAVEEGQMLKVADNIKGWHTRRQMVIIDEATAVPPAIFEACSNLYGTPQEFILVMIGNPRTRLDEFGKFCEPVGGWDSVSVDDEEWETTPKMDGVNGICIRFDAEKSPNILNPLPDGKLISKYLPTKERVAMAKQRAGSENSPSYWSNERGFWAPEGLNKNVFSETGFIAGE